MLNVTGDRCGSIQYENFSAQAIIGLIRGVVVSSYILSAKCPHMNSAAPIIPAGISGILSVRPMTIKTSVAYLIGNRTSAISIL